MHPIGFSTGALAFGDFHHGIALQVGRGIEAIELSALREEELASLVDAIASLDLSMFSYRSFHAPSRLLAITDTELVDRLKPVAEAGFTIVVHPDIIRDYDAWRDLGSCLLLENMDLRKSTARTVPEIKPFFHRLPQAQFCFDIGHARQVDHSMGVATELLLEFRDRLAEVHISEVTPLCKHVAISTSAALAFQRVAHLIPPGTPVIVESLIAPEQIDREVGMVRRALDASTPLLSIKAMDDGSCVAL